MISHLVVVLSTLLASTGAGGTAPPAKAPAAARAQYQIDAAKSRFIVETQTSALSLLFAHDHRLEASEFSGKATFARNDQKVASLELTVKAASLHLLDEKTLAERAAIEAALREDVLETAKYPDIAFKSCAVSSERRGDGSYDVRLTGELLLHGVRRVITIPARVALDGDTLHAIGVFELRQTDFKITPFSFVKGGFVIKDNVTISFDIVATQSP